jgi:hypothetical protein
MAVNEGKKTITFWAAALVMLGIGLWIAWPTAQIDTIPIAGNQLFENFTDPQTAASMKIVTFDEEQGQLTTFEVRRDRESGLWNIPSRDGYPADAIEQMRSAANALIGLKILDVQTSNAEDHDDLGVAEPKLEDLEVGDEGVGRLVTFKNESQETLAAIIIGDQDKSDPEKRYVRIPGQDPVYVVKLDESPLSTKFEDWIESDLLKLSSIDISEIEIQDYTASVARGNELSLSKNYDAVVKQEANQWELVSLQDFDGGQPQAVEVAEDQQLNKEKLDAMKNALDDLKIVNVVRKPEGMSASLKASKDILSDEEALLSLRDSGFFPAASSAEGDIEILSAHGELSTTLKDGVKYVMRFGNVSGVSDRQESASGEETGDGESATGGVNRFLLVTTMVDESKFPVPELQDVPKTVEELRALLTPVEEPVAEATDDDAQTTDQTPAEAAAEPEMTDQTPSSEGDAEGSEATDDEAATPEETTIQEADSAAQPAAETEAAEEAAVPAAEESSQQQRSAAVMLTAAQAEPETTSQAATDESDSPEPTESEPVESEQATDSTTAEAAAAEQGDPSAAEAEGDVAAEESAVELTEEEWQERLEAEQEKITKENQRKLDARKDQIEAAERKVRDLNARFADWYYVIPEQTYEKLRIKREELLIGKDAASESPSAAGPQFQIPGGFPGN